jgi:uncharacterized protein (TIGR00255 family)
LVRQKVRRGSLQVNIYVRARAKPDDFRINQVALASYARQVLEVANELQVAKRFDIGQLLSIPGIVDSGDGPSITDAGLLDAARQTLDAAVDMLNQMRSTEGTAMGQELESLLKKIEAAASQVSSRAPSVLEDYQKRLENKVRQALASMQIEVDRADLLREALLFADRSDIREEIVRLESHIQQFRDAMQERDSQGRKLDFIVQEMFRETNTIGSKGNDTMISKCIVEIKTLVEQIREIVQNIE